MSTQLHIKFPLFSADTFGELKKKYVKQEQNAKDKEIEHLKRVVAAFKGWKTKRRK